ncbi:ABC transporter permease [Periweissella fabaria]|uniref:Putative hemin transport system permease protein HrtB n=1 Tax=Periweissella fabaria TaxID=546157 RepID=A0ABM8Z582_9LACO|nr:FtsX-like permease family protein [Periweissella fabaria]MCM0596574.1 ABC transporter permease [Periweissella fabaria]CAH0416501.1 putative ABC transporter permease [Periweissella fabaria]
MFLAIKEIKHEKLRYALITGMIMLVSYLVFILSGLSSGLQTLNSAAIDTWGANAIVLNKDSQLILPQSVVAPTDVKRATAAGGAKLVQFGGLVKDSSGHKESVQTVGIDPNEFIYKDLKIETGKTITADNQVVVSDNLKVDGFKLGDTIKFANTDVSAKIVGFTKNANLNIAPVVYTTITTAQKITERPGVVNGVVFKDAKPDVSGLRTSQVYGIDEFVNALPGNSAQTMTFNFMIGFLMVIILIVITIFLYILTIQKLPNFGVLKAQGVATKYLVKNTLFQSFLIAVIGVGIAVILTTITAVILPAQVPIFISASYVAVTAVLIIVMSLLGSLIPIREIVKVDPYTMIGG